MATVRCPKCGAINPNGRRRLARCADCHESLGKCRYCQHYDLNLQDCTSLSRRTDDRLLDADEALNCPDFSSALPSGSAPLPRAWSLLRLAWIVGALALTSTAAWLVLRSLGKQPPAAALRVAVEAPSSLIGDEQLQISVMVANQSDNPAREVKVTLSGRGIGSLVCQSVTPEEYFLEATTKSVTAALGDIAPGAIQSVNFQFLPTKPCDLSLTAHVSSSNINLPIVSRVECQVLP